MGDDFYADPAAVRRYRRHRHGGVRSPNQVMEEPALWPLLGDVSGLRVVDLGCGDAAIAGALRDAGCASYLGIDASEQMVAAAREAVGGRAGIEIQHGTIESFAPEPGSVDLVVSRLALHYLPDLDAVLRACAIGLAPGGRLVFSVVHPVITAHDASQDGEPRTSWLVDGYFEPGPRERRWFDRPVTWQHRTVQQYVTALLSAGFTLTALSECPPAPEHFAGDDAELARRRRVPLFLLLAGRREAQIE